MHPTLISLGGYQLSTYGLAVAGAYLAGILWLKGQSAAMGLDEQKFWRLIYCLFFGAVLGGKLMFWAVSYRELWDGRLRLLADIRYGFVFFGGLIGALAMGWAAKLWLRFEYMPLADYFAVALSWGQAIGRLGCLGAGCCYGRPTELPWGLIEGRPGSAVPMELWGVPLHPTQLYEALADAGIGLGLWLWLLPLAQRRRIVPGTVFMAYVVCYGAVRFLIEFLRYDDRGASLPPFSISQWLALAGIAAAAMAMWRRGVKAR
ncbi:MAG: prolipoprotein diacylglyceryl transferase family protein [Elusimicrobiota bacterium]|jgi:phosphatidylglycerol:prolipoprotein diacylglycerol transferase